ncbi:DUF2799 domain-containing protein [Photobacterium sagamiensis]|uniref:DUF2799 domain-containing protein n=1 Tax=Photobacterium sagamiensis TaxID=2910241 RepID=UPI003D10B0EF
MKIVICILAGLLLMGCSGLPSQVELAQNNEWQQIGILDGQAGNYQKAKPELTKLNALSKAAYEEYKQGYFKGIEQFCQPAESYQRGMDGLMYNGQCANTQQEDITVQQWNEGYEYYVLDSAFVFNDD